MDTIEAPHVLFLAFPAQGHVKPLLMLADLLCHAGGIQVTFVNTNHAHGRFRPSADAAHHPGLRFMSIPDGLPPDRAPTDPEMTDFLLSLGTLFKPKFKDLVDSTSRENGRWLPPTCIIADGLMYFVVDVGEELEIPVISFGTMSAACTWAYFHMTKLVELGEIPFSGENMDQLITCIPSLETILRRRDLPCICKFDDIEHPIFRFFMTQTSYMARSSALILNTFESLESSIIDELPSIFPKTYTIGPLHALLKSHITDHSQLSHSGSFKKQDRTCLTWLDSQSSKSVLYVSFGSMVILTRDQLIEVWYGLVNSGTTFLWVIRSDLIGEEDWVHETPEELMVGTKERGCIVGWAPQEEVLSHRAIGGFLTHSGWNSTVESIFAGVPMICWPQFGDQPLNSRCVSEAWRIGVDINDTCDRSTVEKMVRDLIENKRGKIMKSTAEIASMAQESIMEGGSSHSNLEKLIEDIKSINSAKHASGSSK